MKGDEIMNIEILQDKVIFRRFKSTTDIIAIFPEIPGTRDIHTCESYMHLGQHSPCTIDIIADTVLANEHEYKDLYNELIQQGYNLKIGKRITSFDSALRRLRLSN